MISQTPVPVAAACRAVGMPRSSYYRRESVVRKASDCALLPAIEGIVLEFPRYGYRRVTKELARRYMTVNHKRVLRIMQDNNILCKRRKYRITTTDSDHDLPIFRNLAKNLIVNRLNQLWVSDITYILLPHGHIYLAVVIDRFSRKCVGWCLGKRIDAALAISALKMAITSRKRLGVVGTIHHSDQGVQYASTEYVNVLKKEGLIPSMSRRGNPYDNAFAETFMKTTKIEEVYLKDYQTFEEAHENIKEFIDEVYNKKRLHSSIGYMPPDEFESRIINRILS